MGAPSVPLPSPTQSPLGNAAPLTVPGNPSQGSEAIADISPPHFWPLELAVTPVLTAGPHQLPSPQGAEYGACAQRRMSIMEALDLLDNVVDESDPDVDFPNSYHAYQTAEGIRQAHPDKGRASPSVRWDWGSLGAGSQLGSPQSWVGRNRPPSFSGTRGCCISGSSWVQPRNQRGFFCCQTAPRVGCPHPSPRLTPLCSLCHRLVPAGRAAA